VIVHSFIEDLNVKTIRLSPLEACNLFSWDSMLIPLETDNY